MFPYIDLGFFKLPTYGLMLLCGFVAGILLARRRAPRYGLHPDAVLDLATWAIIAGLAGGRLLYVFLHLPYFVRHPLEIVFNRSDFVFFGGAITGALAIFAFTRLRKIDFWAAGDTVAPGVALGHAFGRVGCFCLGCCYGEITQVPWGVRFPANRDAGIFANPAFADHVYNHDLPSDAACSYPVHPTQLYETGANLLICGILLLATRQQRFRGQIMALYLGLYAVARFLIEMVRGDGDRGVYGFLSTSQWIGVAVLLVATGLYLYCRRLPMPIAAPAQSAPPATEPGSSASDHV